VGRLRRAMSEDEGLRLLVAALLCFALAVVIALGAH
jgi:hypothetical protein